jgi:hypothetical protein
VGGIIGGDGAATGDDDGARSDTCVSPEKKNQRKGIENLGEEHEEQGRYAAKESLVEITAFVTSSIPSPYSGRRLITRRARTSFTHAPIVDLHSAYWAATLDQAAHLLLGLCSARALLLALAPAP